MTIENRIIAFEKLGHYIEEICRSDSPYSEQLQSVINQSKSQNRWFTDSGIKSSLLAICDNLSKDKLTLWLSNYSIPIRTKKTVAIIMAGNIPLVGFHDLLCVLISGHKAMIKLSSKDNRLLPFLIDELINIEPHFQNDIVLVNKVEKFDAVIATGSNESFKHFDYYFKDFPKILRRSRTSVAILKGSESKDQRNALAKDIYLYFGLGCRNVTKLYIPKDYDLDLLFEVFYAYKDVVLNNKYANNYDYYKAIYMMGNQKIIENGFLIMKEDTHISSPVSVLNYEYYDSYENLIQELDFLKEKIQCVVGDGFIPFGNAQQPKLDDYADGVDTLKFLESI